MINELVNAPDRRRPSSSRTSRALRHHLIGVVAASGAACAAAGAAESFILVMSAEPGVLPDQAPLAAFAIVITLVALTVGATVLILPAVMMCYPLAVLIARRLRSGVRIAAAGAILGQVAGTAATMAYQALFMPDASPVPWLEQVRFMAIPAFCAGAVMGLVVSTLERRWLRLAVGTPRFH